MLSSATAEGFEGYVVPEDATEITFINNDETDFSDNLAGKIQEHERAHHSQTDSTVQTYTDQDSSSFEEKVKAHERQYHGESQESQDLKDKIKAHE